MIGKKRNLLYRLFAIYFLSSVISLRVFYSEKVTCLEGGSNDQCVSNNDRITVNEPGFLNKVLGIPDTNKEQDKVDKNVGQSNSVQKSKNRGCDVEIEDGKIVTIPQDCLDYVKEVLDSCKNNDSNNNNNNHTNDRTRHSFIVCPSLECNILLNRNIGVVAGIGLDIRMNLTYLVPSLHCVDSIRNMSLSGLQNINYFYISRLSYNAYLGLTWFVNNLVSISAACICELHILKENTFYNCVVDQEDDDGNKKYLDTIHCNNLGFFVRLDFHIKKKFSAYVYTRYCALLDSCDSKNLNYNKYKYHNFIVGVGGSIRARTSDRVFVRCNATGAYNYIRIENAKL